jgi:hypothetical protein
MGDPSFSLLPKLAAASSPLDAWEQAINQVNWSQVNLNTLALGVTRTPSQFGISLPLLGGATVKVLFEGTGFQYNSLGIPSGGTVSKGSISQGLVTLAQTSFLPTSLQTIQQVLLSDLSDDSRLGESTFSFLRSRLEPGLLPSLALSAQLATQAEGNTGTRAFTFLVTRTEDTGVSSAQWNVAGSGANPTNAADFVGATAGTVSFAAGVTSRPITIQVKGDTTQERNETFALTLTAPTGATLGTATAIGTINNDDLIGTAANNTLMGSALPEFIDGRQGRDTLTGGGARDVFGFSFGHSTILAPDRIIDLQIGVDKVDLLTATSGALPAPTALTRAANNSTARTLSDLATAVFRDANGAAAGNQALGANRAALVVATRSPIAGTYLIVNDSNAARNNSNDLLINITGLSGALPGLGVIPVSTLFA